MKKSYVPFPLLVILMCVISLASCQTTKKSDKSAAVDCLSIRYPADCQNTNGACSWDYTYNQCKSGASARCRAFLEQDCYRDTSCRWDSISRICLSSQATSANCTYYRSAEECNRYPDLCIWDYTNYRCGPKTGATVYCTGMNETTCRQNSTACQWNATAYRCDSFNTADYCRNLLKTDCDRETARCIWDQYYGRCNGTSASTVICTNFLSESTCRTPECRWNVSYRRCEQATGVTQCNLKYKEDCESATNVTYCRWNSFSQVCETR